MTDKTQAAAAMSGAEYWSTFNQIDRIVDHLAEVAAMLERNEIVRAYNLTKSTRSATVAVWSELHPDRENND